MTRQLFIGLMAEGKTDVRFLKSVIERTFQIIKLECRNDIDLFDLEIVEVEKDKFEKQVVEGAKKGFDTFGMMIFCIHADADSETAKNTYETKIQPALAELAQQNEQEYCKVAVAIVPVQEIEAWLLADRELLKEEIGTDKSDNELGINRLPQNIAKPKELIEEAIRIARRGLSKKRRNDLLLSDLYAPIGSKIDLEKLDRLSSFQDFKENVRKAFRDLNLL